MNTLLTMLTFIICNVVGFFAATVLWYFFVMQGYINVENLNVAGQDFQNRFFGGSIFIWLICAVFSTLALFIPSAIKYPLLIAPAIVPYIYGFSVLVMLAGV